MFSKDKMFPGGTLADKYGSGLDHKGLVQCCLCRWRWGWGGRLLSVVGAQFCQKTAQCVR